ncbi:hypothetical protein APQ02_22755 [Salmonella enterica]|nr:hypothetical protein [Salmonella enterica]EBC8210562.1 hypothetical protein [Salmonella enterica]EBI7729939.1 hypothetical protein [Salmonella enterica]EBY1879779.1 hypothetical protein [Salmonella enterica subsp. enterica serovar Senftenberg]EDI2310946.1 hypothetical protein [Salmonella enterica subsp. enterica serovar Senftenberg]
MSMDILKNSGNRQVAPGTRRSRKWGRASDISGWGVSSSPDSAVCVTGICRASPARRNDSMFCLNRRGLPVLFRPDKPLKRQSDAKR